LILHGNRSGVHKRGASFAPNENPPAAVIALKIVGSLWPRIPLRRKGIAVVFWVIFILPQEVDHEEVITPIAVEVIG
jgi:hypothetical protein